MVSRFPWLSGALACKSQNHKEMLFRKVSCRCSCSCESMFRKVPNCTSLYEILIWSSGVPLRTGTAFFTRSSNSVKSVIGFLYIKTGVPVFKVLQQYLKHPAFTSTGTDEDHEAPSGNLSSQLCSEQTANQNTNIAWQYCKVARKRTTGFTVTCFVTLSVKSHCSQ